MALSANTIWEVESGGDDTNNGGAFDPSQTAGMFTDGAATLATTAAPVFSSVSYNFVAGDVGAWVYISNSTNNWIPGWYKISSLSGNNAVLNGTIGQAVLKPSPITPSTVIGCATTASPTGATWTIDYSQQVGPAVTYLDLASAGTGLTVSSLAKPFGRQQVGNCLVITGAGTNFNLGRYVIASVAAVTFVATVVGPTNITTGAGANGVGSLGGALASPGQACASIVASNTVFIKAATYSIASASTNIATGCLSLTVGGLLIEGYNSVRGDFGTAPILQASGISTATIVAASGGNELLVNLVVDGATLTAIRGFSTTGGTTATWYKCTAKNCTNVGFNGSVVNGCWAISCSTTGCTTVAPTFGSTMICINCEAYSNTVHGFGSPICINCLAYNNSGTSDGFNYGATAININCTSYGNGRHGFGFLSGAPNVLAINCIAEANATNGFISSAANSSLINCAIFNNANSGTFNLNLSLVTGVSSFFTNAAGTNFSLNNTAGAGAAAKAAGIPGVFPSGTTTGFIDLGAAQAACSAVLAVASGLLKLIGVGRW
jgi:hypothetical protein